MSETIEGYKELPQNLVSCLHEDLSRHVYGDIVITSTDRKIYVTIHNDSHNITWLTVINSELLYEDCGGSYNILLYSIIRDYLCFVCASVTHGTAIIDIYLE